MRGKGNVVEGDGKARGFAGVLTNEECQRQEAGRQDGLLSLFFFFLFMQTAAAAAEGLKNEYWGKKKTLAMTMGRKC